MEIYKMQVEKLMNEITQRLQTASVGGDITAQQFKDLSVLFARIRTMVETTRELKTTFYEVPVSNTPYAKITGVHMMCTLNELGKGTKRVLVAIKLSEGDISTPAVWGVLENTMYSKVVTDEN